MGLTIMEKWLVLILLAFCGCATAYKMNRVSLGMTKEQVIDVLGDPVSVSAQGGVEYLNYAFSETHEQAEFGITRPYYVRIVGGKVESYGRMGDFNSTQPPTQKVIIQKQ